jgi:magnesium-transporting ATPase (P-type)
LLIGLYTFFGGWIIGFPVVIAADIAIGVTCASCPGILNLELTCILYVATKKLAKNSMVCKSLAAV